METIVRLVEFSEQQGITSSKIQNRSSPGNSTDYIFSPCLFGDDPVCFSTRKFYQAVPKTSQILSQERRLCLTLLCVVSVIMEEVFLS